MTGRFDEAEGGEQTTVDICRLLHSRHSSVVVIEVVNVGRIGGGFVGFVIIVFVVLVTSVVVTKEGDPELHLGCGGSAGRVKNDDERNKQGIFQFEIYQVFLKLFKLVPKPSATNYVLPSIT